MCLHRYQNKPLFVTVGNLRALRKRAVAVATNQIWPYQDIGDYAVIEIDRTGVTGAVVDDEVAEFSAPLHQIIQQEVIEPKYLKLARIRSLNFPCKKVQELYQSWQQRKWTAEEWMIARKWLDKSFLSLQQRFELGKISHQTTTDGPSPLTR